MSPSWLRAAITSMLFLGVMQALFRPPPGLLLFGATSGALYGLAATGVILIYRTHRIINFAALAMGSLPAVAATLMQVLYGWPFAAALLFALVGGAALGIAVEFAVIRRFSAAPRLLLTIATIAVAQVIALASERITARLVSDREVPSRVPTPWREVAWLDTRGAPILSGDQIAAVLALGVTAAALFWFLRRTRAGVAGRAAADNVERAYLLGVPVRRLHTTAWGVAGVVAAVSVFFRVPLVGVPLEATLGYEATLFVVAAAVIARMESVPVALAAGVGIGMLEQASVASIGTADLTSALMLVLVVAALLLRQSPETRADPELEEFALEPRRLPAGAARWVLGGAAGLVAFAAPYVVNAGSLPQLTLIPITAVIAVSLVVLTGWAGQVSLGQFAFAGVGAAVAGGLAANYTVDFFLAMTAAVVSGALVAVGVGLPAARVRGIYLAVTTLAFAATMQSYVLVKGYPVHGWLLPRGEAPRIERPALYGVIDLANDRSFYFVCVVFLVVAVVFAHSFRASRSGRVVLAVRDNLPAAAAFGVNPAGARLAAFALSGALAAMGGALLAYHQGHVDPGTYGVMPSLQVFLLTVLGGITSPAGAVLGAILLKSVEFFVEPHFTSASLLFEGPLLLAVLWLNPGGLRVVIDRFRWRFRVPEKGVRDAEPAAVV